MKGLVRRISFTRNRNSRASDARAPSPLGACSPHHLAAHTAAHGAPATLQRQLSGSTEASSVSLDIAFERALLYNRATEYSEGSPEASPKSPRHGADGSAASAAPAFPTPAAPPTPPRARRPSKPPDHQPASAWSGEQPALEPEVDSLHLEPPIHRTSLHLAPAPTSRAQHVDSTDDAQRDAEPPLTRRSSPRVVSFAHDDQGDGDEQDTRDDEEALAAARVREDAARRLEARRAAQSSASPGGSSAPPS